MNLKIDKNFLSQLTGSLDKDMLVNNKKSLSLFEIINTHNNDNYIDIKEITDFANSIFKADTNNDGEVSNEELKNYIKNNADKFEQAKIQAKDILEFLNTFKTHSNKSDVHNQRINNDDGSYSIVFSEKRYIYADKFKHANNTIEDLLKLLRPIKTAIVTKQINYDNDNNITTIESTEGNITTVTDANGKFITKQTKENGKIVSEKKADGKTYYYKDNNISIKQGDSLIKEIITTENGEKITKEYEHRYDKCIVKTTNETTGEISKETIYSDDYHIEVKHGCVTSIRDMNKIIKNPIDYDALHTFIWNGENIINVFAQEDDAKFKKTYITGMINAALKLADTLNVDSKELKEIQKEIECNEFENIPIDKMNNAYSKVFKRIKEQNPDILTDQINNKYYESDKVYTKIITDTSIVVIDNNTNKKTNINLQKLLSPFREDEKTQIIESLKDISAEALLDLKTEVTFSNGSVGAGANGSFDDVLDRIELRDGDMSVPTILHELGHAIDCKGKGLNKFQTMNNPKFKKIFKEEMIAYIKAGNKQCISFYDKNGVYRAKNIVLEAATSKNNSTYATVDEREMFAECYALLMSGTCQSQEVIEKYFPNTMACVLEIVKSTRKLPDRQRH